MFEAMLQGEMDSYLGYSTNDHDAKATDNRRNGYIHKNVKSTVQEAKETQIYHLKIFPDNFQKPIAKLIVCMVSYM